MTNSERRQLLDKFRSSGMEGSIMDVYKAYNQGQDIVADYLQEQERDQPATLTTPEEQKEGLRPYHAAGDLQKSAVFKNVPPNTPFNTNGMKVPINIDKYNQEGHLVESHKSVPPGVRNIPTGPYKGDVIETPADGYKTGGFVNKKQTGGILRNPTMDGFDSVKERNEWRKSKLQLMQNRKAAGRDVNNHSRIFDDDYRYTPPPQDEIDNWVALPSTYPTWQRIKHIVPKKLKSKLNSIKRDSIDKKLQTSTSIPISGRKSTYGYDAKGGRYGQVPTHRNVWNDETKKWMRVNLEPEEIEYYKKQNLPKKKQIIKASFKTGGKILPKFGTPRRKKI